MSLSHPLAGLVLALSLLVSPALAAPPSPARAADKAIAILAAKGVAGEIAVADLGGPVADRVTGLADREKKTPHKVGQTWLWASVTKQVVATLVLQQVGQGKMALDAPIGAYLKDFSGNRTLTLKELLQHRTDLPDPWDMPLNSDGIPAFHLSVVTDKTDQMAAKGFCSGPGKANPNREFRYNNCDYLVLGAALEAVTGQDFETLVKQQLNQGLGLKSVGLAKPGAPKVTGYDGAKPYPKIYASTFGASAAMQGSAADMVRFDRALLGDTLLKAQEKALAWTGDPTLGYEALGVWAFQAELRGCSGPVDLVERRGDLGGIQVRNILAPGQGRALAVFTNDATVDFGEIWQGQGLTYELLSAAFCEGGDLPQAN